MLIQNALYSKIDLYIKRINRYLEDGYSISGDCKTYDESKGDFVTFRLFDINSKVKTNAGFIISELNYLGYLEFTYNKQTNEVYVSNLPCYFDGKMETPVFTSDIAQLVIDKLKGHISSEKINLTFFSPLIVFAVDKFAETKIPSLGKTSNFHSINHIINTIRSEEKKIRDEVLRYKSQKDSEDRAIERALSIKRRIYGIDPADYANRLQFEKKVEEKIQKSYSKQIFNIERHLKNCEKKYKELLRLRVDYYKGELGFVCKDESFKEWANKNGVSIDDFSSIVSSISKGFDVIEYKGQRCTIEQLKKIANDYIERYIDDRYKLDIDSSGWILRTVDYVKREWMGSKEVKESLLPRTNVALYCLVGEEFSKRLSKQNQSDYEDYIKHPIFGLHNHNKPVKKLIGYDGSEGNYWEPDAIFGHAIEILLQIRSLKRKLINLQANVAVSFNILKSFIHKNDLWGSIMQFPYFVRMGRDPKKGTNHELYNLLMISPGTIDFDSQTIRYFVQKGDKSINVKKNCDRITVMIPDSLDYNSLTKVIEYAHDNSEKVNFVCQSSDLASKVKFIIVNLELEARSCYGEYIKGDYFINVDPHYYENFFVNTPNNKVLWHLYDYTSDYPYRRKIIYDLKTIIDMCIELIHESEYENGIIKEKLLSEMLFGSYSGNNQSFDLNNFLHEKQGTDGRMLPADSDTVLAFMQLYPWKFQRELPLIDLYRPWGADSQITAKEKIEEYLRESKEVFLEKKQLMMIVKEIFPDGWQSIYLCLYIYHPKSFSNTEDLRSELLMLKELFQDDWESIIYLLSKTVNLEEKPYYFDLRYYTYDELIRDYKQFPESTRKEILVYRKNPKFKKNKI